MSDVPAFNDVQTVPSPFSHRIDRVECPQCMAENTLARVREVELGWADEQYGHGWRVTNERVSHIRCWGCKRGLDKHNAAQVEVSL